MNLAPGAHGGAPLQIRTLLTQRIDALDSGTEMTLIYVEGKTSIRVR